MGSTINQDQMKNFIADFQWRSAVKAKPEPETVASLNQKFSKQSNHEVWYSCNNCNDHFDVKISGQFVCPTCGSRDLRPGN